MQEPWLELPELACRARGFSRIGPSLSTVCSIPALRVSVCKVPFTTVSIRLLPVWNVTSRFFESLFPG
jgi:hypothetical protein